MRVTVERFYRFRATHELKEFGIPRHEHDYEVAVTAEQGESLLLTETLDEFWDTQVAPLPYDLGQLAPMTTVEGLAQYFLDVFSTRFPAVVAVSVMEDRQRRGRAEA